MKSLEKDTKYVQLSKISFDVNNPRGEKEHQIVSDPEFQKLISSIRSHGILEPLIVKKDSNRLSTTFMILMPLPFHKYRLGFECIFLPL